MDEQDAPVNRKLRRFHWWDRSLWWRTYTPGGFDGYRTADGRKLACATMQTAITRPDMADPIRTLAARRRG
jgi:hypothetical protein